MFVYILNTHSKDALFKKKIVREMKFHVVIFSTVVMCVCFVYWKFSEFEHFRFQVNSLY